MKKMHFLILTLILAGLMLVTSGCGAQETTETPTVTPVPPTAEPASADTPEEELDCDLPLPSSGDWEVALCEPFNDNSYGWQEETQDNPNAEYTSAVEGGKFVVDYRTKNFAAFTRSALTWFDVAAERNFVLSVTGQIDSTFADASWGVAFRRDEDNFYLFSIQNDDSYIFEIYEDNRWIPLITRKQTNLIRVGEPNTLRIEAGGGDFYFSINGDIVNQFSEATLPGDGIQLMVSAKEGASAVFTFDDVVLLK